MTTILFDPVPGTSINLAWNGKNNLTKNNFTIRRENGKLSCFFNVLTRAGATNYEPTRAVRTITISRQIYARQWHRISAYLNFRPFEMPSHSVIFLLSTERICLRRIVCVTVPHMIHMIWLLFLFSLRVNETTKNNKNARTQWKQSDITHFMLFLCLFIC